MIIVNILQVMSHIAVIAASVVAIWGINAWRREFKGKRDIELAEDVLCLFYRAERAIEAIRFPIYNLREGQNREPEPNETPEQKQARDRAYVVFKKIMEHSDIFDELYKLRFRFMARFGKDKVKPFDEVKRIVDEIWVSTKRLAELWTVKMSKSELSEETQKRINEHEAVIWSGWGEDTIKTRLEKTVQDVEEICRPIIGDKIPRKTNG